MTIEIKSPTIGKKLIALPQRLKRAIVVTLDVALCLSSFYLSMYLRLGDFVTDIRPLLIPSFISISLAIPIFFKFGLYRAIFRFSGSAVFAAVLKALFAYAIVYFCIFTLFGFDGVPRTVGIIQPTLFLLFIFASRALASIFLDSQNEKQTGKIERTKILIYGAGNSGRQLASVILNSAELQVFGFLDDDVKLQGRTLNGLSIYDPNNIKSVAEELEISDVLLAVPNTNKERLNSIIEKISQAKVAVRVMPNVLDLAKGKVTFADMKELEIDDLLGRDVVSPFPKLMSSNVTDKIVMVTGAGGSIGSEISRQILPLRPAKLLLVEQNEYALYTVHQELEEKTTPAELIPLLASVCDEVRMHEIMLAWQPATIFHAAAYKHVPLVEQNLCEGLKNNAYGTLTTAQAALKCEVENFVLISTDKAVRPTNFMGASKRLAELILQALSAEQQKTKFCIVRFGNVLGSSGSVVPKFRKQIDNGGPLTITHQDVTRFFMTVEEASQLVIQASAMSKGGEVFILDMGEPVKILDLAHRLVRLSGFTVRNHLNPDGDIEIKITGMRPGEKLYEELLLGENPEPTDHPRIMHAHEKYIAWKELEGKLATLGASMEKANTKECHSLVRRIVPDYHPNTHVIDLVYLSRK